jgi:nucleoid-associated protein YgaU
MASRYRTAKTTVDKDTNKSYMETTIYPKVSASNSDIYIITDETDRLDLLAFKYYGDSKMWWIIANANNINDATFYVEPGTQLRIPSNIQSIINNLTNINK